MTSGEHSSQPARILVVEDDERILDLLRTILGGEGYQVDLAADAPPAFALLTAHAFDLAIIDRMLPGVPGDDILKFINESPRTAVIPVLFLTALDDVDSVVEAFDAGAKDYVTKPFNAPTLLARVRALLRVKSQEDELRRQRAAVEERNLLLTMKNAELARLDEFKTGIMARFGDENRGYIAEILQHAGTLATSDEVPPALRHSAAELGRVADGINQALRPYDFYKKAEEVLQGKSILIADADPRFRRITSRAVIATGATVHSVGNRQEAVDILENNKIEALFVDWEHISLINRAQELYPGIRCVLMTDQPLFVGRGQEMLDFPLASVLISNVLARTEAYDPTAVRELVTTAGKLMTGDIFGLEKYLGWGTAIREERLTQTVNRRAAVRKVTEYARECGLRKRQVANFEAITDELLMNAIWDAPVDEHGVPKYADRPRKEHFELEDDEAVTVRYGSNGNILGVSVSDPFGRLEHEVAARYLVKCFAKDDRQIDTTPGGAGLGMFLAYKSVSSLIINVTSRKRTEVIGLLDMNKQISETDDDTRSFCYFRTA